MKNILTYLFLLLTTLSFSQTYQVVNVEYEGTVKDLKNINITRYFKELIRDLIKNNTIDKKISLQLHIPHIEMSIDTLLPVSLIINEIVSNSLKHAFNDSVKGEIRIDCGGAIRTKTDVVF